MLDDAAIRALVAAAAQVRCAAHVPYSGFRVGAAAVTDDDRVFLGCNVENASYGLSLCAERAALAAAVAGGGRRVRAMVIVSEAASAAMPCGACRQWMAELGAPDMEVVTASPSGLTRRFRLEELLPFPFLLGGS